MDAPSHFISDGKTIDQIDLSACIGKAKVITMDDLVPDYEIKQSDLKITKEELEVFDVLFIHTNWMDKWGQREFYQQIGRAHV